MAQTLRDAIRSWLGGVVTAGVSDRQNPGTSPHALNSMMVDVVKGQTASIAKRPGLQTVNQDNDVLTGGAGQSVVGMADYRTVTTGNFTRYHVYVLSNSNLGVINSDPGDDGAPTNLTVMGGLFPEFVTAKNLLFYMGWGGNGKLRGLIPENFGIARKAGAGPLTSTSAAGVMSGTFEARFTYYNANTDHESSASETSPQIVLNNENLVVAGISVSLDTQVTARKVYIRDVVTQTEFRLAATINDNVSTSVTLDVDPSTLIILGPDTVENDPPPSTASHMAWINSRMFVADDSLLYWSKKNDPESFDSSFEGEPIGSADGQKITGLYSYGDYLLIFKSKSVYVLSGTTPESWKVKPLFTDIGCVARTSIVEADGNLYWWSHKGPVRWDGAAHPTRIGELLLGNGLTWFNHVSDNIQAAVDITNKLVLWAYPKEEDGLLGVRNNGLLAFSYDADAFVATDWDPMNIRSLATVEDANGVPYVYAGNYNAQIFRMSTTYTDDGVPGGTMTGTFVAGASSITTITASGFYTTGEGLKERMVTIEDSSGQLVARRYITANTATDLTLNSAVDVTSGETYTFYVGGINFEWDTVDHDSGVPFVKKRYEWLNVAVSAEGATIGVDFFTDVNPDSPKRSFTFSAVDGLKDNIAKRFRASAVGRTWRLRVRNRAAGVTLRLDEAAMQSEVLTGKLG